MLRTYKILLVDDDPGTLAVLESTFDCDDRFELFMAQDGVEALRVCREVRPDAIVLDVALPCESGYSVCRLIKEDSQTSGAWIVLVSALGGQVSLRAWKEAGADKYMPKPFSPDELLNVVMDALQITRTNLAC